MKQEGQFSKNNNLLLYAIQLLCVLKWNKRDSFQKKKHQFITVCYSTCMHIEMKQEGQFSKNNNLLQYAIQLVCILKWNKRDSFQKNNNLLQYAIQLVCVLKWNKRDSFQKTTIYYSMLFNLCAYWNETRGTVFKKNQFINAKTRGAVFKKTTIYYSMLFNLCAYWNETRGTVFKKKHNLLQYAIQLVCVLKWNKRDSFQKKKNTNLLQYAIQLVCILKWNKMDSFQKNPINDNMLLNLCAKWNKRGSFQKTTIYYSMLFNLCAYWNETRGTVLKKKQKKLQFITVCYSTCMHIEMKQEGQFSKNNNLLQYAIQLVCVLEWNKRGSFQKNPIDDNMLLNSWGKRNKRGNFQKTTIYYIMLFNKRGSFQKTTIYYSMIFNLCPYWNETRWTVFKKKQKKSNLLQYAIQLVCILEWNKRGSFQKNPVDDNMLLNSCAKWNKRGSFQKTTIYYCMLFNLCAYWNETRGTVFKKKHQFITVCYSTCMHIEMKQEGQFSKNNNLLQYAIQLVCILKWNKMDSFQKNPIKTICY